VKVEHLVASMVEMMVAVMVGNWAELKAYVKVGLKALLTVESWEYLMV